MFLRQTRAFAPQNLPVGFYFTDETRTPDPLGTIARLPPGSSVIYRHYSHPARRHLAKQVQIACAKSHRPCFIAKDAAVAAQIGADGVHLPDHMIQRLPRLRQQYPKLIVSVACHGLPSLLQAQRLGADLAFLSPLFATQSHPGSPTLSPIKAANMLKQLKYLTVYGLGGITPETLPQVFQAGFQGFGAISFFEDL